MFLLIITPILIRHWVSNHQLAQIKPIIILKSRGTSILCIFLLMPLRKIQVRMGLRLWRLTRATSASLILKCLIQVIRTISIPTLISINSCRRGMLRITLISIKPWWATSRRVRFSKQDNKTLWMFRMVPRLIHMLYNKAIKITRSSKIISSTNQWADISKAMILWDICRKFLIRLGFRRPRAKEICIPWTGLCTKTPEEIWEFRPQYI